MPKGRGFTGHLIMGRPKLREEERRVSVTFRTLPGTKEKLIKQLEGETMSDYINRVLAKELK